ncbi:MAG TPA: VOC family protein [Jatrophihabitans sp.]|jgi:hypothetical protein
MVNHDQAWPQGTPCWVDLGVDDVGAARLFYESLFGWQIMDGPPEAGGYLMCMKNGRPAAGLGPKMSEGQPSSWTAYLAADDADAVSAAIRDNGGQLLMEPMDVMDVGKMAIAADPGGAVFGVWQAKAHTGTGIVNEPGSVIWNENMSRSWQANKDFYAAVFGWEYGDMSGDGFNYATFKVGGVDVGGIGELAADEPDAPAGWTSYFAVTDADEAADEVVKLGGSIIRPPSDSPYGRLATVADSEGSVFAIMAVPADGYPTANEAAAGSS